MGNFRFVIDCVGGHGQDRTKKDGEVVDFTNPEYPSENTPERIVQRCIDELKASGCTVNTAKVHHWPKVEYGANATAIPISFEDNNGKTCINDDLLTGVREGQF